VTKIFVVHCRPKAKKDEKRDRTPSSDDEAKVSHAGNKMV